MLKSRIKRKVQMLQSTSQANWLRHWHLSKHTNVTVTLQKPQLSAVSLHPNNSSGSLHVSVIESFRISCVIYCKKVL